MLIVYLLVVTK